MLSRVRTHSLTIAALAASTTISNLPGIIAEFGVIMVPTSRRRRLGETHAKAKLRDIFLQHGEDHLRLLLRLIRGTVPNAEALWSEIFEALSDVLVAFPAWKEREPDLHAALDTLFLEKARAKAVSLRPWPVRGSLRVLLWIALEERLEPSLANSGVRSSPAAPCHGNRLCCLRGSSPL